MSKEYRKKSVKVEAIRFTGDNVVNVKDFIDEEYWGGIDTEVTPNQIVIKTDEGQMRVSKGDWTIKGVKDEFYPCGPYVFEETYEQVEEN